MRRIAAPSAESSAAGPGCRAESSPSRAASASGAVPLSSGGAFACLSALSSARGAFASRAVWPPSPKVPSLPDSVAPDIPSGICSQ